MAGTPSRRSLHRTALHRRGSRQEGSSSRFRPQRQPTAPQVLQAPFDPVGLFCQRPQRRVDTAVSQGLSILAGLVLGGALSAGAGGSTGKSSSRDPEPDPDADDPQQRGEGRDRG
jgi:hypothetical protein